MLGFLVHIEPKNAAKSRIFVHGVPKNAVNSRILCIMSLKMLQNPGLLCMLSLKNAAVKKSRIFVHVPGFLCRA